MTEATKFDVLVMSLWVGKALVRGRLAQEYAL